MELSELVSRVEALLWMSEEPLMVEQLAEQLGNKIPPALIQVALLQLKTDYQNRGVELVQTPRGSYRFQVGAQYVEWLTQLPEYKPPKYSRAFLETLALIAYRQPITRPEIEAIRGVSISASLWQTLQDRGWIQVQGQKEVPGRPDLWVTTHRFLTDFNLKTLSDLPTVEGLSV